MKPRAIIGIEISSEEVRAACIRTVGGAPQLVGVASVPTPRGGVDAEGMLNTQEMSDIVRRVCAQLDSRAGHVVVGISGCNLVARVMEIPPVPDSEVRAVLRGEMDHYRILPTGQSAFDYFRLPEPPIKEGNVENEPVARILLMGAEEKLVSSYRAVIDASNLTLDAVEPASIAILRALYPMLHDEQAVTTIILSSVGTDIFITHQGDLQFYRRVDTGVPELYSGQEISAIANVNQLHSGLLLVSDEISEEMPEEPAAAPDSEDPYQRQAISLLMTEVQRSIDYYTREFPTAAEKMLVRFAIESHDAADLFTVMSQYLRSKAEMASATEGISISPDVAPMVRGPNGCRYTVAIGLALRRAGGSYENAPALDLSVGDHVVVERRLGPRVMLASVLSTSVILLVAIIASIVFSNNIARAQQRLTQANNELKTLTQEHEAKVAHLNRQKQLTEAIHLRDKPLRGAIEFVAASITGRACLTYLSMDQNGSIFVSGEAINTQVVADIMDKINRSPVLDAIRLNNLVRIDAGNETTAWRFELQTAFIKATKPVPGSPTPVASGGT